jgi:hypothetical protein
MKNEMSIYHHTIYTVDFQIGADGVWHSLIKFSSYEDAEKHAEWYSEKYGPITRVHNYGSDRTYRTFRGRHKDLMAVVE